jgi:hypothetical protein
MTNDELEQAVKAVTSRMDVVDKVAASKGALKAAFVCSDSGMYFPADYVKEWGNLYGIGLGPDPVSETLQSIYHIPPANITRDTQSAFSLMHPVRISRASVHLITVPAADIKANSAVLAEEDNKMALRAPILFKKQMVNPKSKLKVMMAGYKGAW